MTPNPVWVDILLLIGGFAVNILLTAAVVSYKMGKREASQHAFKKNTQKDVQELHEIISTNNDLHNENYKDLETLVLKIKSAFESYTGRTINGVDYRHRS